METLFRDAAIGLARQYPFARQLVNTGRMAVANSYQRSPVCEADGGVSVQNAPLAWADGTPGTLNDLLAWGHGQLLLLVFGALSANEVLRLRLLAGHAPLRCVQVVAAAEVAQAHEHVRDPDGKLLRACHAYGHRWALLRPDGYLAATGEAVDAAVVRATERALAL